MERLVIGLEEPVLIKGLGELSAKIDSGNGGYNVIHGTDFHQQGSELMFTTHDSFGHDKKIQAKVIDTIEVNMGGGNIESRPVIELDIKFAGEDYKKIPFSISDRSTNSNPILISKGFIENELEALIDVGAMNISNDGIDVVYGEGFGDVMKKVGSKSMDVIKPTALKAWDGTKYVAKHPIKSAEKANDFLTKAAEWGRWASGKSDWKPDWSSLSSIAKSISQSQTIVNDDMSKVKIRIPNLTLQNTLAKSSLIKFDDNIIQEWKDKKINPSSLPITLVTSFMMTKGNPSNQKAISGLEQER